MDEASANLFAHYQEVAEKGRSRKHPMFMIPFVVLFATCVEIVHIPHFCTVVYRNCCTISVIGSSNEVNHGLGSVSGNVDSTGLARKEF
jgi:hypothetical protein